jgi:23S rRNA (cytosine1962-C5)-methyltransferase
LPPRLKLRVTSAAETIIRSGHPWLFADSVSDQNRAGTTGELAVIYDRRDRFLALGLFDPDSPIRVRILHRGEPEQIDESWWTQRLCQSIGRRTRLFDHCTTGYRLINGESDGWPGLVLDRYEATLVLKLYTPVWFPKLNDLIKLVQDQLSPSRLVLRLSRNIQAAARETWNRSDGEVLAGAPVLEPITCLENGLRFEADVVRGQKTGFFLDQRENRRRVEALGKGKSTLNAFSFTGGFSVYAARGGAPAVTDLDISGHALDGSERNFKLNDSDPAVRACRRESIRADAFEWLEHSPSSRKFGLIILDPPSLAKREAERRRAIGAYRALAASAILRLARGGVLVASSCSAHVSAEEFFEYVRKAAAHSRPGFREIETTGHAGDHPATFPEAHYLKAIYLQFDVS